MKRNRIDELIDGEIDGTNTQAENEELQAILSADPQARRRREEVRESVGLIERAGLIEPPAGLRRRIEAALATAPAPAAAARRPAAPATLLLRDAFGWSRRPASALAFAAGILVAVALLALARQIESGPQREFSRRDLLGVVLPPETPVVDSFADTKASGSWRAVQTGERTLLRLELETDDLVDLEVHAGEGAVCAGYLSPRPPAGGVAIAADGIALRGLPAGNHDLLFLQDEPGPLDVGTRITAGGAAIEERSFTVGRSRRR